MRKAPSEAALKRLFALSGNQCAFPGCEARLVDANLNLIGQVCHIEAAEPGGQRYNTQQTDEHRAAFENLLVLCANDHIKTNDVNMYTVPVLQKMKADHEKLFVSDQFEASAEVIAQAQQSLVGTQHVANNGAGIQVASQFGDVHFHNGLTLADATGLFRQMFDLNLPKLTQTAKNEAVRLVEEFKEEFVKKAEKVALTETETTRFAQPDVQYALNASVSTAARRDSSEMRKVLAGLLVKRVRCEGEDLRTIALSEAAQVVGRVTVDQLRAIALTFMLRYTKRSKILTVEQLKAYFEMLKPLIPTKIGNADFQHLAYSQCASINEISHFDLQGSLATEYEAVFCEPFDAAELQRLPAAVQPLVKKLFFRHSDGRLGFLLPREQVEQECKTAGLEDADTKTVLALYKRRDPGPLLADGTAKTILDLWNTGFDRLTLTSVGIAIGAIYYEEVTGDSIDLSIWLS